MAMRPELTTDPEAVIAVSGPCVRKEGMKRNKLIWSWRAKTLQRDRLAECQVLNAILKNSRQNVHLDDQLG